MGSSNADVDGSTLDFFFFGLKGGDLGVSGLSYMKYVDLNIKICEGLHFPYEIYASALRWPTGQGLQFFQAFSWAWYLQDDTKLATHIASQKWN